MLKWLALVPIPSKAIVAFAMPRVCNFPCFLMKRVGSAEKGRVSEAYGSWLGDSALRNSFLVDPDGVLQEIFPIVNPSLHVKEVLDTIQSLQS